MERSCESELAILDSRQMDVVLRLLNSVSVEMEVTLERGIL